jgi:hypothetical protein
MEVTVASSDEREPVRLEVDVPSGAEVLVLVDEAGNEYHFGCGMWVKRGTFLHVATYSSTEGLQKYAFFWEVADAIAEGRMSHKWQAELGPKLSSRTAAALTELRSLCNQHNGFSGEPEKRWAVETLRALWEGAHDRFDPREVYVWAATHGWAIKDAKRLQEIAEGVRDRKNFQGYDRRPIRRDHEKWRRMIEQWDRDAIDVDTVDDASAK